MGYKAQIVFCAAFVLLGSIHLKAQIRLVLNIGNSYPGTINVNAPMGTRYQDVKHAVFLQGFFEEGSTYQSTGFLVNTVNQNGKYYIMTATHTLRNTQKDSLSSARFPRIGEKINLQFVPDYEAVTPSARTPVQNFEFIEATVTVVAILPKQDLVLLELDRVPERLLRSFLAGYRRLQQNEGSVSYNNTTSSLKVNVCKKSD